MELTYLLKQLHNLITMKNIFYVISLVLAMSALWGCNNERTDYGPSSVEAFTYRNTLNMPIDIYSHHRINYSGTRSLVLIYKMRNEPDSIIESATIAPMKVPDQTILNSDSIRIVFNNTKELWYYKFQDSTALYNPLNIKSYKLINAIDRTFFYEYHFTQQMYDMAADIKK